MSKGAVSSLGHIELCWYKTLIWKVQRHEPSSFLVHHLLRVPVLFVVMEERAMSPPALKCLFSQVLPLGSISAPAYSSISPHLLLLLFLFCVTKRRVSALKTHLETWRSDASICQPIRCWNSMGFAQGWRWLLFSLPWIRGHRPVSPGTPSMHDGSGTCCQLTFTI